MLKNFLDKHFGRF